jgi:group I intron endonuclease
MINSGIYKIVNKINGKSYYGSSIDFDERWTNHKRQLNTNKHKNNHLQRSYNKYGIDNFIFLIIEYVEKPLNYTNNEFMKYLQTEYEQDYLDIYWDSGINCFNNRKNASGGRNCGFKQSQKTKDKLSIAHKGKILTKKHKDNISISLKGKSKNPFTEEHKNKLSIAKIGHKNNDGIKQGNTQRGKVRDSNTSGFVGVSFDKSRNKWFASISYRGKLHNLGRFNTAEQASEVYQNKLKELK